MRSNIPSSPIRTEEGAVAKRITPEQQLRRLVMSCMLFEKEFYVDGVTIAENIKAAIKNVSPRVALDIAVEARNKAGLRHVPLLILSALARDPGIQRYVPQCINRPDEMAELIAIYWRDGKKPIPSPMRKGLARTFTKFNEYSLSKNNRDGAIKLRDVLFLCHAKPLNIEQDHLWKKLIGGHCSICWSPKSKPKKRKYMKKCTCGGPEAKLEIADTWETSLSGGEDKKDAFTRLIIQDKLGALAVLKNLRNMQESGVDPTLIKKAIIDIDTSKVFPYRFISAARYATRYEPQLEMSMFKCIENVPKLNGRTVLLIDVSGSMDEMMSSKSEMKRIDAACGLAMICREICNDVEIYTFSSKTVAVPPRRGFALRDAVVNSQIHSSTRLDEAIGVINNLNFDRLIVITDEQIQGSFTSTPNCDKAYMINVASNKNGVGYGKWIHIDGFSEAVLSFIKEVEN